MKITWVGPLTSAKSVGFIARSWVNLLVSDSTIDLKIIDHGSNDNWPIANKLKSLVITKKTKHSADLLIYQEQIGVPRIEVAGTFGKTFVIPDLGPYDFSEVLSQYSSDNLICNNKSTVERFVSAADRKDNSFSLTMIAPPISNQYLIEQKELNTDNDTTKFIIGTVIDQSITNSGLDNILLSTMLKLSKRDRVELRILNLGSDNESLQNMLRRSREAVAFKRDDIIDVKVKSGSLTNYHNFISNCKMLIQTPRYTSFDFHLYYAYYIGIPVIYLSSQKIMNNIYDIDSIWSTDTIKENIGSSIGIASTIDTMSFVNWQNDFREEVYNGQKFGLSANADNINMAINLIKDQYKRGLTGVTKNTSQLNTTSLNRLKSLA